MKLKDFQDKKNSYLTQAKYLKVKKEYIPSSLGLGRNSFFKVVKGNA